MAKRGNPVWAKARRLAELPELLKLKERTTKELAAYFGVTVRDAQRDIQALREMGQGVEETRRGAYRIPSSPASLSALEALAVYAAVRLLHHHAPTRSAHYKRALEKLAHHLPEPAREAALGSAGELSARSPNDRTLELVARAWFEGRVLAFHYLSANSRSGRPRPGELLVFFIEINRTNLETYAVGFERTFHRKLKTFKLSRMSQVDLLLDTYTVPEAFDPREYFTDAWGVIGSDGAPITARLRFAPEAASRVREGGYPNLEIVGELPSGHLEVKVRAGVDEHGFPKELFPWVQSWGRRIEVMEPENLRRRWLDEARAVMMYSGDV